MKYDRNDLNLSISFTPKLSRAEYDWAFKLTKSRMESVYDSSGYGWDDDDKKRELSEQGARFLIAREKTEEGSPPGPPRAFVHFRFTVQGEVMDTMAGDPCLYVWDVQLEPSVQRKGLGKHLLMILELIARREKMEHLCVPVQLNDETSTAWIESIRGFAQDDALRSLVGFDAEMEVGIIPPPSIHTPYLYIYVVNILLLQGFEVYTKTLTKAIPPTPKKPAGVGSPQGVEGAPATPSPPLEQSPAETPGTEEEEEAVHSRSSVEGCSDDASAEADGEELELNQDEIISGLQVRESLCVS